MKSLEQFLSEYFQERTSFYRRQSDLLAPLHQKFFAPSCPSALSSGGVAERSQSERILSVSHLGSEVVVVTNGVSEPREWRLRYHLRPSGDTWQIHEVEWACLGCDGSGKLGSEECFLCHGKGWQTNAN